MPPGSVGTPAEFETDSVCTGRVYVICNAHTTGPRIFLPGKFVRQPRLNRPSLYRPSLYPAEIKPAELLLSPSGCPRTAMVLWSNVINLQPKLLKSRPWYCQSSDTHPPLMTPLGLLTHLGQLIKSDLVWTDHV